MRPKCHLTNSTSGRGAPSKETDSPTRRARALAQLRKRHVWLCVALGLLTALAFVAQPARAAVTEAWVQRYSYNAVSNSADYAIKVVCDAAGDIIVTGNTDNGIFWYDGNNESDILTIKYSGADGSVLWQKRYNDPTARYVSAQAVAVDNSGNVVVTGYARDSSRNDDCFTAKYAAADGALLWEKRYNGPANRWDYAVAVAVDGSGNVVVTGESNGDYYTAKYAAADGAVLWEQRYNGPANGYDWASAVAVDGSGNVVVTGESSDGANSDYYTAKYAAADGALLWEKRYNDGRDQAQAVAVDGSGNVLVTGNSASGGGYFGNDYYTAKYAAADGALLWEKRYNGPANGYDRASAVAVDGSGNVVVTGFSGNATNNDYYTAKYAAADGALLWEKRDPGGGASAVAVDGSGNVVVTGFSNGDYYTAKYAAANGVLLWEKRYNGPANTDDRAAAVVVDGSGNVVVTGSPGSDYYTGKYAAGDGTLLWEQRYDGPRNYLDIARAVAVDGSGNVVVTGTSYIGLSGDAIFDAFAGGDYYTAKYAAGNGALLWEQRYNGPANNEDHAAAVVVDGSGNVVVAGYSYDDYYTAKYAAADGALLWEKRYNGPANGYDRASAVAVDGSGNVVVTGYSGNTTNNDYYTAKYAAADGALLWEKRYNGLANSDDRANAVVVDGSGNVVVTGNSATIKYLADGTGVWTNSSGGVDLAVDSSGNVVVTGSSTTTKYRADGTGVWTNSGGATALAVDGSGTWW